MFLTVNTQLPKQNGSELLVTEAVVQASVRPRFVLLLPLITKNSTHSPRRLSVHIKAIKVPLGISYVHVSKVATIQLRKKRTKSDAPYVLEPIEIWNNPRLLIICSKGYAVWINGQLAPRISIAKEKDEILFDNVGLPFFVSLYSPNKVVKIPEYKIGVMCPICRRKFEKNSQVYICYCGMAVHSENTSNNEDHNVLICASLINKCLDCGRMIDLYSYSEFSFIPSNLV